MRVGAGDEVSCWFLEQCVSPLFSLLHRTSQGQVYVVERSVSKLGLVHGRLAATIQPCVDSDGIGAGATDLSVATVALCPDGTLVAIATRGNLQVFDVSTPSRPLYLAPSTVGWLRW